MKVGPIVKLATETSVYFKTHTPLITKVCGRPPSWRQWHCCLHCHLHDTSAFLKCYVICDWHLSLTVMDQLYAITGLSVRGARACSPTIDSDSANYIWQLCVVSWTIVIGVLRCLWTRILSTPIPCRRLLSFATLTFWYLWPVLLLQRPQSSGIVKGNTFDQCFSSNPTK